MRRATKTTPPMTPPTIAPVLTCEPPTATAPLPVEEGLGLDEVGDMTLLVVGADVEVPAEDVEIELAVELEVDILD